MTVTEKRPHSPVIHGASLLREDDLHYFNEGSHTRLYRVLGAHPGEVGGARGVHFGVWAPNARAVSVVGDFNGWEQGVHALATPGGAGIWTGFVPGVAPGALYKYHVVSRFGDYRVDKSDPFGFYH